MIPEIISKIIQEGRTGMHTRRTEERRWRWTTQEGRSRRTTDKKMSQPLLKMVVYAKRYAKNSSYIKYLKISKTKI